MMLEELIAHLGEVYLAQGDIPVQIATPEDNWVIESIQLGDTMGWILLTSMSLGIEFVKMRQLVTEYQQENVRLRNRVGELDKEIARTQYIQQSIIKNWTSIDINSVDTT